MTHETDLGDANEVANIEAVAVATITQPTAFDTLFAAALTGLLANPENAAVPPVEIADRAHRLAAYAAMHTGAVRQQVRPTVERIVNDAQPSGILLPKGRRGINRH